MTRFIQAAVKGSYTPLANTLKQVDSITKDDVVKVSYVHVHICHNEVLRKRTIYLRIESL